MLHVGGYAFQVTKKNLPSITIRCTQLLQRIHSVCEFFSLAGFGHLALKQITGTNCTTRACVTMPMFQGTLAAQRTSKVALAHESILVNIGLYCTPNFCYCLFCFAFTKGGTCVHVLWNYQLYQEKKCNFAGFRGSGSSWKINLLCRCRTIIQHIVISGHW